MKLSHSLALAAAFSTVAPQPAETADKKYPDYGRAIRIVAPATPEYQRYEGVIIANNVPKSAADTIRAQLHETMRADFPDHDQYTTFSAACAKMFVSDVSDCGITLGKAGEESHAYSIPYKMAEFMATRQGVVTTTIASIKSDDQRILRLNACVDDAVELLTECVRSAPEVANSRMRQNMQGNSEFTQVCAVDREGAHVMCEKLDTKGIAPLPTDIKSLCRTQVEIGYANCIAFVSPKPATDKKTKK